MRGALHRGAPRVVRSASGNIALQRIEGGITVFFMPFPEERSRAVVLSYDDGVEQDAQLMEILDRYGIKCTFNLNSGMFAPEDKVWEAGFHLL